MLTKNIAPKELVKFIADFCNESDRAAVIVGASKIDLLLNQILKRLLIPNPTSHDDLFDGDAPLSTFSSKIHLSYRLGIIDAEFTRALHIIRRIRNDFAHELTNSSLDSGPHTDRVKQLVAPFQPYDMFDDVINLMRKAHKDGTHESRIRFSTVLAVIFVALERASETASVRNYGNPIPYFAEGWKQKKVDENKS